MRKAVAHQDRVFNAQDAFTRAVVVDALDVRAIGDVAVGEERAAELELPGVLATHLDHRRIEPDVLEKDVGGSCRLAQYVDRQIGVWNGPIVVVEVKRQIRDVLEGRRVRVGEAGDKPELRMDERGPWR